MRVLILGIGNVGRALAERLKSRGHHVIGTTTTPEKVAGLEQIVDDVAVLFGHERDKVAAAAANCDAVVVTVAPNVMGNFTVEEREANYRRVLVESCQSATSACDRVIFASSFSVYGDGGDGVGKITEETPCSNSDEPSSKYYQLAEQAVLAAPAGCVLRFPDMYGAPGDMSYPDRVRLCHQHMGGKAIFSANVPLYCIHYLDVVRAIEHALRNNLEGIFNVCDDDSLPYTNQQVFDAICEVGSMPKLEFLEQIQMPNRQISAARIYSTGYRIEHKDPNAAVVETVLGSQ